MKNFKLTGYASLLMALAATTLSCNHSANLDISLSDKFEGKTIEVVNYLDSTVLATTVVENGKAKVSIPASQPVFTALYIDGRARAFYVTEPGNCTVNDSTQAAVGTPLNDRFAPLLAQLDSIEDLDYTPAYVDFVKQAYNDNIDNPLSGYFGIEWVKYAEAGVVDSLLASASEELRNSPKAAHYLNFARLRSATAPGMPYVDFEGEDADGKPLAFSSLVNPDKYTLVDFFASWCPYCIKEMPQLIELSEKWGPKGLNIVGVAVRDVPDDTKAAIVKHNISWPVLFNAQRRPYDIYGFSGIPHHILLAPDGTIVARGENPEQIDARLSEIFSR